MLMDAHCSCRSACETRELPEFSSRARVEKTRSADLVAHLLPHLHKALQQHGPHAHAYIHKHLTAPPEISPQGGHSPNRLPAKPWLPGLDTCQLTRDGCFDIDHFASMQDHDNSFPGHFYAGSGYKAAAARSSADGPGRCNSAQKFPAGLHTLHNLHTTLQTGPPPRNERTASAAGACVRIHLTCTGDAW